ncbi:MAG: hypothetical protein JWP19_663 [Rhodoglobus sp.]|nr:hypothetical protein [Rhodoglobus sp.]
MVLCHVSTVLAIDLPKGSDRVDALWKLVRSEAAPGVLLDEVIRSGLSSAPNFVLVGGGAGSQTRVLVRGSALLRVSSPTGEREISGEGVSSWIEQVLDGISGYELQLKSMPAATTFLPLESGVVRAVALRAGSYSTSASVGPAIQAPAKPAAAPKAQPVDISKKMPVSDLEATLAGQTTTISAESLAEPVAPSPAVGASDSSGYDHLFGETVVRKVEDAAVRESDSIESGMLVGPPPPASGSPAPAPQDLEGDHDGHTVMVSDIAALRARRKAARAAAPAPEPPVPTLYLELSTGGREQLDQPLIIGRAPSASRVPGGRVPRLVSMNTPNQDISRTHAQITAEGGTVVVTDLHSSNGTMVTLPGKPAQKLRPGEPSAVIVGTIIDLGDGATLTVCESV